MSNSRFCQHIALLFLLVAPLSLIAQVEQPKASSVKIVKVNTTSNSPNEVTIAINPANPAQMIAASNINNYYLSNDSGYTWQERRLQSPLGVWGDPVLYADKQGNFYYCHLSKTEGLEFPKWIDRMVVQKSTDGGRTFSPGAGVGHNPPKQQDKEWIVIDETGSVHDGNIYLSWTEFDTYNSTDTADHTRIRFARSTNGGKSFSEAITISDTTGDCLDDDHTLEGATPAVGPNGEVYVVWAGHDLLYFDKSLDGGQTFGKDQVIGTQPGGWAIDIAHIYRSNGMPFTVCDLSGGAHHGTIYVNWVDTRNGDADVWLMASKDQGATWSQPLRVNNDRLKNGKDQFLTQMVIDQSTGYLYIVFYDRRHSPNNTFMDVYLAVSRDGGQSFTNKRVTSRSFPAPAQATFYGDYISVAVAQGVVRPIWTDVFNGALEVKTAILNEQTAVQETTSHEQALDVRLTDNGQRLLVHYSVPEKQKVQMYLKDPKQAKTHKLFSKKRKAGTYEKYLKVSKLQVGDNELIYQLGNEKVTRKFKYTLNFQRPGLSD